MSVCCATKFYTSVETQTIYLSLKATVTESIEVSFAPHTTHIFK